MRKTTKIIFAILLNIACYQLSNAACADYYYKTHSDTISDGIGNYDDYSNCTWTIQPLVATNVTLNFLEFKTQKSFDYVMVYDGTASSGILLGAFSGNQLPPSLTANSGKMYVVFKSNYNTNDIGFKAVFTSNNANADVYCLPKFTLGTQQNNYINNVSIGGITNLNSGINGNYQNFTGLKTTLIAGNTYSMSLDAGSINFANYAVFLDYNHDLDFNDANELVYQTPNSSLSATVTFNVNIPNVSPTLTRMRIVLTKSSVPITMTACATNYGYGEAEDYTINIINANSICATTPVYTNCSGTFSDGSDYNQNYYNSQSCAWLIQPTGATSVALSFSEFNTEANNDVVKVYEGTNAGGTLLGTFSGSNLPATVTSNTGAMYVTFITNSTIVNNGFKANYVCNNDVIPVCHTNLNNQCNGNAPSIYNFRIENTTLNNFSTCTSTTSLGYTLYPPINNKTTTLVKGNTYTLSSYTSANAMISCWIDYNHNFIFEPSEFTEITTASTTYVLSSATVTIPLNAISGLTYLRVRSNYVGSNNGPATACANNGFNETEDYQITIAAPTAIPVAQFSVNNSNILVGSSVNYRDESTNTATSWQWSFPGGTPATSAVKNPTNILYSTPGCYSATLIATNSFGSDTISYNCFVNVQSSGQYCIPNPTYGTYAGNYIDIATLGAISTVGSGTIGGPSYSYNTSMTTELFAGESYSIAVNQGAGNANTIAAWIDYNNDGDFNDANEKLDEAYNGYVYLGFAIPNNVTAGIKRLRIRVGRNNSLTYIINMDACTDYDFGETEDYNVTIKNFPIVDFTSNVTSILPGSQVNFTDLTNDTVTSWLWTFPGGTPATSTLQNPSSIVYNSIGVYNVTLLTQNIYGSFDTTKVGYIEVTNTPNQYCIPTSTNTATTNDFINSVSLGSISNLNTGYTAGQTYQSYISQSTNLLTGSSYTITVMNGNRTTDVIGAWIDYNEDGDFNDPNEKLTQFQTTTAFTNYYINFTVPTSASAGTKRLRIKLAYLPITINPCGNYYLGETEDYSVNIFSSLSIPTAAFNMSSTNICVGDTLHITNTSILANANNWTFSGAATNSSSSLNPSITFNVSGTQTVKLIVTNANGSDTLIQTVNVLSLPVVNAGSDVSICNGASTNIATPQINNANYLWSPSNGLSFTSIANPTASPNTTTTYKVIVTSAGCSATDSLTVNVLPAPTVNLGNDVFICNGGNSILNAGNTGAAFAWSPSVGLSNTSNQLVNASPTVSTTYYVAVTSNGCTGVDSVNVIVNPLSANAGNDIYLCGATSTNISAQAVSASTYSWSPTAGVSNPNILNPTITPSSTTTYTLTVSDGLCTASDNITLYTNSIQPVIITLNGTTLSVSNFSSYQWYYEGVQISSATSQTFTPTQAGNYTVQVADANGCTGVSQNFNVILTSIASLSDEELRVKLYPNPASNQLTVEISSKFKMLNSKFSTIKIQNTLGQTVFTKNNCNALETFDVSGFAKGVYFVRVGNETTKFIKQ